MALGFLKRFLGGKPADEGARTSHLLQGEDAARYAPIPKLTRGSYGEQVLGNPVEIAAIIRSKYSVYDDAENRDHRVIIREVAADVSGKVGEADERGRIREIRGFPYIRCVCVTDLISGKTGWLEFTEIFEITELDPAAREVYWVRDRGPVASYLRILVGAPFKTDDENAYRETKARLVADLERKDRIAAWAQDKPKRQQRRFKPGLEAEIETTEGARFRGQITTATFYGQLATVDGPFREGRKRTDSPAEFTFDGFCETTNRVAALKIDGALVQDAHAWVTEFVANRKKGSQPDRET